MPASFQSPPANAGVVVNAAVSATRARVVRRSAVRMPRRLAGTGRAANRCRRARHKAFGAVRGVRRSSPCRASMRGCAAMKRIVLCFDGTWNTPDDDTDDGDESTNVHLLWKAVAAADAAGVVQDKWYDEG